MDIGYSESESESKSNDHAKKNIMEQMSNINSCKVISMLLLPEDLMINIISRVSLKCLLNSARYVCKPWATIIGSSHFAEAQHAHSKPGLYVEDLNSKSNSYFMDIKDDLNGHFERIDLGRPPEMGRLMGTCDGLLLFWCYDKRIFVLNPILKCGLKVPSPPTSRQLVPHKFIMARAPRSSIFKLFFVDTLVVLGAKWYVFYVLKIGIDNSWKEIARKKDTDGHQSLDGGFGDIESVLYSGGNDPCWINLKVVMVMDVDKEIIVGEYALPIPPLVDLHLHRIFLWMENQLSCIVHKGPTTFQIYKLDFDSRKWTLYDEMGPFDYVCACSHGHHVYTRFRFWMNGQLILQLFYYRNRKTIMIHYVYNIKTRRLTKIEGIPEDNFDVWLHTNSLALMPSTST